MNWVAGRGEIRDLAITRFDTRAQFMNFEFNCRTRDNVELVLEGCFFWEVVSLPDMITTTADPSGDKEACLLHRRTRGSTCPKARTQADLSVIVIHPRLQSLSLHFRGKPSK